MAAEDELLARLVESDVPVAPDAQQLQIDAARRDDGLVIGLGRGGDVLGVAVGDMDVLRLHIHLAEQVVLHEAVIRAHMIRGDADVLIQVEADGLREVQHTGLMHADQRLVCGNRGGAGGKAEDAVGLAEQLGGDHGCGGLADLGGILKHMNLHWCASCVKRIAVSLCTV